MNWDVIPEIFYDLIARIVPGALVLVLTVLVINGVLPGLQSLLAQSKEAPVTALGLFFLLAYFVAVILQQLWNFGQWLALVNGVLIQQLWRKEHPRPRAGVRLREQQRSRTDLLTAYSSVQGRWGLEKSPGADPLLELCLPQSGVILSTIRRVLPVEGYRLLKIQAEKGLCEALIPGLLLLLILDGWLLLAAFWLDRGWLLLGLVVALGALLAWRTALEAVYLNSLCVLWHLLETTPGDASPPPSTARRKYLQSFSSGRCLCLHEESISCPYSQNHGLISATLY